ncbi:ETC complex I subunit [Candidatus Anaplasma sp. TIGMIC]|uniref:ETC complex I subunit n=1 Tax=Candidatus Anaplasma sp. TIGMIC TaxID=3020713 RepID=UPI00232DBF35|nr:ETC complex I subunit [Candidatus Anaplasma sp. TIGMIC]MDB1135587.1 ETC complex I subunit [Candidatus Anaplasma sp. TIGMIC]
MHHDKTRAVVHRPAKNAMQSGSYRGDLWYVDFEPSNTQYVESLMGWVGSSDTSQQVRLSFNTKEEAISYVQDKGIPYIVLRDNVSKKVPKSYASNFLRNRGL